MGREYFKVDWRLIPVLITVLFALIAWGFRVNAWANNSEKVDADHEKRIITVEKKIEEYDAVYRGMVDNVQVIRDLLEKGN